MSLLQLGERAPDFSARDARGELLTLSSTQGPVALLFLRYLGCPICRETSAQLADRYLEIAGRGVDLWVIVPSALASTKEFSQKHKLPYHLIADPGRQLYRLYEVGEDKLYTDTLKRLSGQGILTTAKLMLKHGHGLPEGSERQRMGAFLIDGDGFLRYQHVAGSILEELPLPDLFRAIDALPPRRVMGNS